MEYKLTCPLNWYWSSLQDKPWLHVSNHYWTGCNNLNMFFQMLSFSVHPFRNWSSNHLCQWKMNCPNRHMGLTVSYLFYYTFHFPILVSQNYLSWNFQMFPCQCSCYQSNLIMTENIYIVLFNLLLILSHYGITDKMVYNIPMMRYWWPSNWFVNTVLVSQRLKHGALFLHGISLITSLLFPLKSVRLEIWLLILFL